MSENEVAAPEAAPVSTQHPRVENPPAIVPPFYWNATQMLFSTYFSLFHGVRVRCINNIPRCGRLLFAPNHSSYYDPPLIGTYVPWQLRFMAWDALFKVPGLAQWMRAFGAFPVRLKSADRSAVETTLNVLRDGGSMVIFPEGQRCYDGKLGPFEKGMARMALSVGATVVPVAITGAYDIYSRHHIFPRFGCRRIVVKFYPGIALEPITNPREMRDAVASLNARVRHQIERRTLAYERLKAMRKKTSV